MTQVHWGPASRGVRFGLCPPDVAEAGGTIIVQLFCQNDGPTPINIFGFQSLYPRSLRVSPPKVHRPHILVSFGDENVLHPPEGFTHVAPGQSAMTTLDLSFAFDRRGTGRWQLGFAYSAPRANSLVQPWTPAGEGPIETAIVKLDVAYSESLREAGIDEATEMKLDAALFGGDAHLVEQLRAHGEGGAAFAARRVARILSPGAESLAGWRAFDALGLLGAAAGPAVAQAREELPHAEAALSFAEQWLAHRASETDPQHLPFVTQLDRVVNQPDARGNFVLSWTGVDSAIHGLRRVQIFGNGERIVTIRDPGSEFSRTRRTMLRPDQMRGVAEALRFSAVWLLRPLRERGLPDEPRPTLEVELGLGGPFRRNVAMWNGEWRQGPASPLADFLDRLASDHGSESIPPRF